MHEHRTGASGCDPPRPLPDYLRPRLVDGHPDELIVGSDLRLVASLDELEHAVRALRALGVGDAQVLVTHREGSPWLELDAIDVPRAASDPWPDSWRDAPTRLALWRYTLAAYSVGADGAVSDDPIYRPGRRAADDDG